jgi:hypothetical protein
LGSLLFYSIFLQNFPRRCCRECSTGIQIPQNAIFLESDSYSTFITAIVRWLEEIGYTHVGFIAENDVALTASIGSFMANADQVGDLKIFKTQFNCLAQHNTVWN